MAEVKTSPTPQFHDHLWQGLAEGFFVLDEMGEVTDANEAAAALLGYAPDELIGQSYRQFWPEDVPSPKTTILDGALFLEARLSRSDGRFTPVNLAIFPLDASGTTHILVSISNQDQVQRFNDALLHTQRLAGIGTLTAGVAHELITPISIITNTCSNLREEIEDDSLRAENLMRYVQMIEHSVWRCTRIVSVLRNYTFDEALLLAVTDLNTIIEDALTLVRHQFRGEYQIEVDVSLGHGSKSIVCDHNRITQVLINLLVNARDAMQPDGGTIRIKSWSLPSMAHAHPTAEAGCPNGKTADEAYALSVEDGGHGIAPAIMDKIFDPFFTTKPSGQGTGLGLFLARRIVTQHNGRIWAENNPDGGATFTVVLPRKQ